MKKFIFYLVIIITGNSMDIIAQGIQEDSLKLAKLFEELTDQSKSSSDDIKILSKTTRDGIHFRWAPVSPRVWQMGIDHGYTFERLGNDGNYEPVGEGVFRPWEKEKWMAYKAEEFKYVHIAAMCIYGDSEAEEGFVNQANELSRRHGFNLFAADLDKIAAAASGFSYVEKDTSFFNPTRYRIYVQNPVTGMSSDTSYFTAAYYGLDEFSAPQLEIVEEDSALKLQWGGGGYFLGSLDLVAYHIEKSTDGINFQRMLDQPFINALTELRQTSEFTSYIDSVDNGTEYYYRIIGIDPFGDLTTPSNVASGIAKDLTAPDQPFDLVVLGEEGGLMNLSWNWQDASLHGDIAGFDVYRSKDYDGPFEKVNDTLLAKNDMQLESKRPADPLGTYFLVEAIDLNGNRSRSLPKSFLVKDSTPPGVPTELRAEIDSNGVVLIEWTKPPDEDLLGYELFYSNGKDQPFVKQNVRVIKKEYFVDELSLATLTKERYYRLVAMDFNYNRSNYSDIVIVERPDTIAPEASIFESYNVTEEGIQFTWIASQSDDVVSIELMRKSPTIDWELVSDFDMNHQVYVDRNVEEAKLYEYKLVTKDDAQNYSESENTLLLEALKSYYIEDIEDVSLDLDGERLVLHWSYDQLSEYKFLVYKQDAEGDLVLIKMLSGKTSLALKYTEGNDNVYAVRAQAKDGRKSKMSKRVTL